MRQADLADQLQRRLTSTLLTYGDICGLLPTSKAATIIMAKGTGQKANWLYGHWLCMMDKGRRVQHFACQHNCRSTQNPMRCRSNGVLQATRAIAMHWRPGDASDRLARYRV